MVNNKIKLVCMAAGFAGLMTSCLSEDHDFGQPTQKTDATGWLRLNIAPELSFGTETRALNESTYENEANYTVEITDNDGKKYSCTGSEAPTWQKKLPIGLCTVKAYYGEELAASRDKFYMYGEASVNIEPDGEETVNVDCYPTCAKLKVAFDSDMSTYFNNYYVEFSGTSKLAGGKFTWAASDTDPYYVAITKGATGEDLNFIVTMTAKDEYVSVINGLKGKTGTISGKISLKRQDFYTLKVKPNYNPPVGPTEGSLSIEITIDDTTVDHPITYEVPVNWI